MEDNFETASIQHLLAQCPDDWGDPIKNRELLIPLGLGPIDKAIYGIDAYIDGDLLLFIGEEKKRKSTLVTNIIINYMTTAKQYPVTVIDSLESGVPKAKVRDLLLCNLATRYLMDLGHRKKSCLMCQSASCNEMTLNPEFLRYNTKTPSQEKVIEDAREEMNYWPLYIFDASKEGGWTRNLDESVTRWKKLIEEKGASIFEIDHIQQYSFKGFSNEHEKQVRSIAAIGDTVAEEKVAFLVISQVSYTSIREARQGLGDLTASGGKKGAQEANVEFLVGYSAEAKYITVDVQQSRRSAQLRVNIPIEEISGAICGNPIAV